ncbi:MAG: two-component regulator propeller domain-containing protein, partial [Pseudomonadota bacterium]
MGAVEKVRGEMTLCASTYVFRLLIASAVKATAVLSGGTRVPQHASAKASGLSMCSYFSSRSELSLPSLPAMPHRSVGILLAALLLNFSLTAPSIRAASLFDLGDRYFESFEELEILNTVIVMDIEQDSLGFIWLATQKGLLRYDGYEFKKYTFAADDPNSLSGNYIRTIENAGGKLWLGTNSDGISVYDPLKDSFTRIKHDPENPQSLADDDIWSLASNDKWVVVATHSGINLFSLETYQPSRIKSVQGCDFLFEQGRLASLAMNEDSLFIGSYHGLCKVDLRSQTLLASTWVGAEIAGLNEQRVFNLDLLRKGELWVATRNNGIAVLDLETDSVRWVLVDEGDSEKLNNAWIDDTALVGGAVWAGTVGGGVAIIDPDTLLVREHIIHQAGNLSGLSLNDVSAVFKDDADIVWLGTWGGGLNRYNPANSAFKTLRQNPYDDASLGDSHIQSVRGMQNGDVWLGTALSGVQVMRPGVGLVKRFPAAAGKKGAIQNPYIHTIEQLPNGEIWVGTNQTGVYRYNEATDDFTQFTTEHGLNDNLVRTAFATKDGTLWLGTDGGLTRVDTQNETFEAVRLAASGDVLDNLVGTITAFQDGLWVGTNDGLLVIPQGENTLHPVEARAESPLSDNYISDLTVDSSGRLWVATSQGLDILTSWDGKTAAFESVNQKLGLPPKSLGGALEEDSLGRMWVQANLIDPRDWSYTRINRSDGWDVGNTWIGSNASLKDGTLLFGGTRGLMMVRPEEFQRDSYSARLVITKVEVDSRPLTLAEMAPLVLPADIKSFAVEFADLNYASSQQVKYRYRLEGYDDEWVVASPRNRRATYSRLAPADYVLRISSAGDGLAQSYSSIEIPVRQLPRWFETSLFRAAVGLLMLAGLYLIYRLRVRSLYRQKRALDSLVEQRTENIRQLAQAGQDITASLDLDVVVESIQRHVSELMDAAVFAVGLVDPVERTLEVRFQFEKGQRIDGFDRSLDDETSPAVWCVSNRRILSAASEAELARISPAFRLDDRERRTESMIFHPLLVEEKTIGLICLQSYKAAAYGENERQMLQTIASYAAVAIDNAESLRKLNEAKAEIERASLTDQLTGLSNRRFLDNLMSGEINRMQRLVAQGSPERIGVILVDADHFKQVNDSLGHDAGDRVLVQLAEIL